MKRKNTGPDIGMNMHIKKPGCFLFYQTRAVFHEHAGKKIKFADQISQTKTKMKMNEISYMNKNFLYQ